MSEYKTDLCGCDSSFSATKRDGDYLTYKCDTCNQIETYCTKCKIRADGKTMPACWCTGFEGVVLEPEDGGQKYIIKNGRKVKYK